MGQLAAGLAHELRNPLTSMKILVQAAAERGESATLGGRHLAVLEEEITRMDRAIQTFLDYARPPKPEKQSLALVELVEQTVELLSQHAVQLGVQIDCEYSQQAARIIADPGQIRQVLLNLLLNAVDAGPDGGRVIVQTNLEPSANADRRWADPDSAAPWITIAVADTGCGLPSEMADRIFEPFVSTKDGGTGLGLAICKRIVEDHGGQITAGDRAEGGAVFTVRLPAYLSDNDRLLSQPAGSTDAVEG
jgi:signal transduction histidine kinase